MLLFRKILFYCFVLTYLILCPLLIFHALGISFRPELQTLERTGLIYLTTTPPQAVVYLNHTRLKEKTPTVASNLPAGTYSVDIILKNYRPWNKILDVKESKATAVDHILLIPNNWNNQIISKGPFQELSAFEEFPFFLVKRGPLLKDIFLMKWKEGLREDLLDEIETANKIDFTPLVSSYSPLVQAKILRTYTITNSSYLFIDAEQNGKRKFLWVNSAAKIPAPKDLTELILEEPKNVVWDHRNENLIYIQSQDGEINIINVADHTIRPNMLNSVQAFTVYNNRVYALLNDYSFELFNDKGELLRTLLLPAETLQLLTHSQAWKLTALSEDVILFLNNKGSLLFNIAPFHLKPEENIRGFQFDRNNRRLLLWTERDVGFADVIDERDNKFLKITWLNLSARNINQAAWANKGHQILYCDNDTILLTDTESFDQPEIHEIAKIKHNSTFIYSDNIGKVFYLTDEDNFLAATEIIPQAFVLSLPSLGRDQKKGPREMDKNP